MAHDHDHVHGDRNAYYLNQLFTIAVCGALGGVAVMLWWTGKISLMLHPKFFLWVLLGGLALLTLVVIRAVAVWRSVDETAEHTHSHEHDEHEHGHRHHEHEHGIRSEAQTTGVSSSAAPPPAVVPHHHHHHHDHNHDHGHSHSHGHDHDHEHGWAPWRYVVLLLPVVLYFLNLPNKGFSADAGGDPFSGMELTAPQAVQSTGTINVSFVELQQAASSPENREFYEGKTVTLTGQYDGNDPRRFTLVRYKIACCGADAVRLNSLIMVDRDATETVDPDKYRNKWVKVTGRIQFIQKGGTNEFITAVVLSPRNDNPITNFITVIPQPSTIYVY